jgi:hypothetical protein
MLSFSTYSVPGTMGETMGLGHCSGSQEGVEQVNGRPEAPCPHLASAQPMGDGGRRQRLFCVDLSVCRRRKKLVDY